METDRLHDDDLLLIWFDSVINPQEIDTAFKVRKVDRIIIQRVLSCPGTDFFAEHVVNIDTFNFLFG